MGSRLIIALSGLLVVATANATSILGIDDATSLSNFGTGMKLVTPQIGSGYTYFPGTTTVAATNEDAAWDYTYYASSNVGPQQALVTTTSIIPNTWVDYNSGDWIGFCDCATSTTYTGDQVIFFDPEFFVANSEPASLPNAYIDLDFAADTRAAGSTAQVVITARAAFEEFPEPELRRIFEVNVFGTMRVTRRAIGPMRRAGVGRIVILSSIGGRIAAPSVAPYSASKFALEGFGEALFLEMRPFGIDVALVEPGIVRDRDLGRGEPSLTGGAQRSKPLLQAFLGRRTTGGGGA